MFGTIRKHQSWLWAIIITVIIISFVWFFSPYTKMHDTGRGMVNLGSIYGRKITDQDFIHWNIHFGANSYDPSRPWAQSRYTVARQTPRRRATSATVRSDPD